MVKSMFVCAECDRTHRTYEAAIRCEVSFHEFAPVEPLKHDTFYTIAQVSKMTGITVSRIGQWMKRHGRIFEHMINVKSQTDYEWCRANGRSDLLTMRDRRTRYLVPARDIDALRKAQRLFDTGTAGQGFDTGAIGAIVVHSESGGAFRVPVK